MGQVFQIGDGQPCETVVAQAADILLAGGVGVFPTETVYGIGMAISAPRSPDPLFSIKHRARELTIPWLVGGVADLDIFGSGLPSWAYDLARIYWPGALTLIVNATDKVAPRFRSADGTIALRMSASPIVAGLIAKTGCPLATTSANTHGMPAPASFAELEPCIVDAVDIAIDGGRAPVGLASTIVDCTQACPRIVRQGSITESDVSEVFLHGTD